MLATKPFSFKVIGAFDLIDRTGGSVRPTGRKDSAILAILTLTRNHRQTRTWLQDKLWSDRGPAQGAASLRQALTTIRTILNVDDEVFQADRTWVWLDAGKVEYDHLLGVASGEILRGFDQREEGFSNWLRETRSNFEARQAGWGAIAVEARPDLDVAPKAGSGQGPVQSDRRMVSIFVCVVFAIVISLAGLRLVEMILEVATRSDVQPTGYFAAVDALLTLLILTGGSDGIHQIMRSLLGEKSPLPDNA